MSLPGNICCSLNWILLLVFFWGVNSLQCTWGNVVSVLLSQCVGDYLLIMREFTLVKANLFSISCSLKGGANSVLLCMYSSMKKCTHFTESWKKVQRENQSWSWQKVSGVFSWIWNDVFIQKILPTTIGVHHKPPLPCMGSRQDLKGFEIVKLCFDSLWL